MTETSKIAAAAFSKGESRSLAVNAEKISEDYLVDGKVPKITATHKATEKHPTHEASFFDIEIENQKSKIENVQVQLNGGASADDEDRLAAIAEDLLKPPALPGDGLPGVEAPGDKAPGTAGGCSGKINN